jgi:hypothetical protein
VIEKKITKVNRMEHTRRNRMLCNKEDNESLLMCRKKKTATYTFIAMNEKNNL